MLYLERIRLEHSMLYLERMLLEHSMLHLERIRLEHSMLYLERIRLKHSTLYLERMHLEHSMRIWNECVWNTACCIWNGQAETNVLSSFHRTPTLTHDPFEIRFGRSASAIQNETAGAPSDPWLHAD